MTCHYQNSSSDELLQCMGLTPIYSDSEIEKYASDASFQYPRVYNFVLSNLRVNRMIRPNLPEGPCQNLHVSTGVSPIFAGLGGAAAIDPEPISKSILAGVTAIGSFFSHLFSGAPSARELEIDCTVVGSYNAFASAMEAHLKNGNIQLQDAISQLGVVVQQLQSQMQILEGYDNPSWAPYAHRKALDALKQFNTEVVYPQLAVGVFSFLPAPIAKIVNEVGGIASKDISLVTGNVVNVSPVIGLILLISLIALGIHFFRGIRIQRVAA